MKIAIAADHGGFELKEELKEALKKKGGIEVVDLGAFNAESVDYPDFGAALARRVASGEFERGI
ncbi:MAG TPA: RpiB/LacA/LacB family sugar-phosphate isomerase, partial [Turneriella sp.]|nr:RpiB/LacA/LacB family sugar-phosphate isomerase [Turneriella sp.]